MRLPTQYKHNTEVLIKQFSALIYFLLFLHISSVLLETWKRWELPSGKRAAILFWKQKKTKKKQKTKNHNIESTGRKTKVLKQKQRVVVSETYSPLNSFLKSE